MKRIYLILIIIIMQFVICCCTYYDVDPFITTIETSNIDPEAETTKSTKKADKDQLPDDFYTLSPSETYEKYGMFTIHNDVNYEHVYDGKYIYTFYPIYGAGNSYISTLGKYEYPSGEVTPLCTDPLCTHSKTSACPFAVCGGFAAKLLVIGGNVYFMPGDSGKLYVYDKERNKSVLLLSNCYRPSVYKYDNAAYISYSEEDGEFSTYRVFIKLTEDGGLTELGRLNDYNQTYITVYKDRYAIDYETETYDGKMTVNVLSRDLKTKETRKITDIDCPEGVEIEHIETDMIYGENLLVGVKYCTKVPAVSVAFERKNVYLIDLETGDQRFICSPDHNTYKTNYAFCYFSQKAIFWYKPMPKKGDLMIVHIYFPLKDEEKVYNLSEMIKEATGDDLPAFCYPTVSKNSSVSIIDGKQNSGNTRKRLYEVDLESGRIYKYDDEDQKEVR